MAEDKADHSARKLEEMATAAENILGLFTGARSSRRVSTSMTKRRMTSTARADVQESLDAIEDYKEDLLEIAEELQDELEEIKDRWNEIATDIDEKVITPYKKDIHIDLFGLGWAPYWRIVLEGEDSEIRAFK
jgi:predicted nuclease with TOPRIM domain